MLRYLQVGTGAMGRIPVTLKGLRNHLSYFKGFVLRSTQNLHTFLKISMESLILAFVGLLVNKHYCVIKDRSDVSGFKIHVSTKMASELNASPKH